MRPGTLALQMSQGKEANNAEEDDIQALRQLEDNLHQENFVEEADPNQQSR
jgi:hypothetical protein